MAALVERFRNAPPRSKEERCAPQKPSASPGACKTVSLPLLNRHSSSLAAAARKGQGTCFANMPETYLSAMIILRASGDPGFPAGDSYLHQVMSVLNEHVPPANVKSRVKTQLI